MGLINLKRVRDVGLQRPGWPTIAIDFGCAALKVLQVSGEGTPELVGAGAIATPEDLLQNVKGRLEFQAQALPELVWSLPLRGRRAVCAIPSSLTFCKHAQFPRQEGMPVNVLADSMLSEQLGRDAGTLVRRVIEVRETERGGAGKGEFICLATGREIVERLMKALKAAKLEAVGMHSEFEAVIRAFTYLNQRESDRERATLYLDIGAGQTRVAIGHAQDLAFARAINFGGGCLDACFARELGCSPAEARARRLESGDLVSIAPARAPAVATAGASQGGVAVSEDRRVRAPAPGLSEDVARGTSSAAALPGAVREQLEILTDEVGMCIRYHDAMFPGTRVAGIVFVGGESRDRGLCQHVARTLRLPAQAADPLARVARTGEEKVVGVDLSRAQPGWAVAVGLCQCPTDL